MIEYITVGTNNVERAAKFYDSLLDEIGTKRFISTEKFIAWSVSPDVPAFAIAKPKYSLDLTC